MAEQDLTVRMQTKGSRSSSSDVDRLAHSVKGLGGATRSASAQSKYANKQYRAMSGSLRSLRRFAGVASAALGVGLAYGFKASIQGASNLYEEINKTNVVFRGSQREMLDWSKTSAMALMMSQQEALSAANIYGNMIVPLGLARDRAGQMSRRLVLLAADLASFNNASPAQVLKDIRSGLAGEVEPLRKFGIFLTDVRLKQQAMSMGLYHGKGILKSSAKLQAAYALMLKDSADANGDAARTSEGFANMLRILSAAGRSVRDSLGMKMLPVVRDVTSRLVQFTTGIQDGTGAGGRFADAMTKVWNATKAVANKIGDFVKALRDGDPWVTTVTTGVVALGAGIWTVVWATRAWAAAQWLLNAAMAPVIGTAALVIGGLVALGVVLAVVALKSKKFRSALAVVGKGVVGLFKGMAAVVKHVFESVINWFVGKINFVLRVINLTIRAINKIKPGKDIGQIGLIDPLGGGDKKKGVPNTGGNGKGRPGPAGPNVGTGKGARHQPTARQWTPRGMTAPAAQPAGASHVTVPVTLLMPNGDVLARAVVRSAQKKKAAR